MRNDKDEKRLKEERCRDNEYESAARVVRDSGRTDGIQLFPKSKQYPINFDQINWTK